MLKLPLFFSASLLLHSTLAMTNAVPAHTVVPAVCASPTQKIEE